MTAPQPGTLTQDAATGRWTVTLGPALARAVASCEIQCEAGCCGLEAFHLSSLLIGAHLVECSAPGAGRGGVRADWVEAVRRDIDGLKAMGRAVSAADGRAHVRDMNHDCGGAGVLGLAEHLDQALDDALVLVGLARRLDFATPGGKAIADGLGKTAEGDAE